MPEVGTTLSGRPVLQGYHDFIFTWSFMNQENFTALWQRWNPTSPLITVQYIHKGTGLPSTMTGMMHEPLVGTRNIVFYQNVALKVTRTSA